MSTINVNFNLSESINSDFHIEKIKFAQSLLDYYNNKLNLQISLDYTEDFKFNFMNNSIDDFDCASFVNHSTSWFIQERIFDKDWLSEMIDREQNKANNIKSSITTPTGLNVLTQSDIDFFIFQKDKFKAIYKDLDCFTFLSLENQELLKIALNNICDDLDKTS